MTDKYYKVIYETISDDWDEIIALENEVVSEIKLGVYNDEKFKVDLFEGAYIPYMYSQFVNLRKDMLALEHVLIKADQEKWDENAIGYINSNLVVWVFETTRFLTRIYLRMTPTFKRNWPKHYRVFEEMIDWYKQCGKDDDQDVRYVRNTVSHYDSELNYAKEFKAFIQSHQEYINTTPLEAVDRNTIANGLIQGPKINDQMKRINISIPIVAYELLDELSSAHAKELVKLYELTVKKLQIIEDKQKNV